MRKKVIIIMLLTVIIINSLTGSVAMASKIDDNATGGGSSSGLTSGNGTLNWNQTKSGNRLTVIDRSGNVKSFGEDGNPGSVDWFFMEYKGIKTPYYYTNCKTKPLSAENSGKYINKRITIDELNKVAGFKSLPPYPISTNGTGTAKGNGDELRDWLMAGKKWIGQHVPIKKPSQSASNNNKNSGSSSTGNSSNTGNSNNAGNSKPTTPKYDIRKLKADIISSGKKLKLELDANMKIDLATKRQTYYSWLSQWKNYCIGLYNEKEITKENYDDIILGTGLDMLTYMEKANFVRRLIISSPSDVLFYGVKSAVDKNLETYINNINKLKTYNTSDKRRLLNYYVEGEKEYFKELYDSGILSKNVYSYANKYIEEVTQNKYKTYSSSSNSNTGKILAINMSTTDSMKTDNQGDMVQTLSYAKTKPVYLSSAPTNTVNADEVEIISLSTTTSNNSSSTTGVGDKGEILRLLNAEFKGKPLFELPEHSLPEYAGMNTVDIMVEKGYLLLVENLTYIQPATWNSSTKSAGVYFKYHIFGTITNYAECLTLLKEKNIWTDMGGGAYSTPTSKLGWSALMTESDWEGDGITIVAPTKTEGTRRAMDKLASASDLIKGIIEGYGMQLYMTNPEEETPIPTPTPTPVITTGDSGIILHENEITNQFSLLDAYEGNKNKLKIQSSISSVNDRDHTVYSHDNHGTDEEGNEIACTGHLCKVLMKDNNFNHIYGISKLIDSNNVIANSKYFTSKLIDNSTGVSTVGLSGNDDTYVYPNYNFTLFRSMDKPTLIDYANSETVKKELGALGLSTSDGGVDYHSSRMKTGSNEYSFNLQIGKDSNSDTTTTYSHSLESIKGNQTHTLGKAEHGVDVTIKTFVGIENIGKESSDAKVDKFEIDGYTITNPTLHIIDTDEDIIFYPYVKMQYTSDEEAGGGTKTENAYILSDTGSFISNSDCIEMGYIKSNGGSKNLLLESNQWSNHKRSINFTKDNSLDRYSVLPGGATYTIEQVPNNKTYVGIRTWMTVLPDNVLNRVASGEEYYSSNKAKERRDDLLKDINKSLSQYKLTQYVTQGIEKEQKNIISKGKALDKISAGLNQNVYGNKLSKDAKYYLKSTVPKDSPNSNAIFIANERNKQLVRTVEYTISSDTEGNVNLYKNIDNGVSILMGFISKSQTAEELINLSEETQELDSKTKLITNYVKAIDRNLGKDAYGNAWYNEAFDGISVVLSEYLVEVALTDYKGNGAGIRSSVLDPKLCGFIASKSDILNFSKETANDKVRSSCFAINPNQISNHLKGIVAECNWGDTVIPIQLRNIEYLFLSKTLYIPNGTVMDISK